MPSLDRRKIADDSDDSDGESDSENNPNVDDDNHSISSTRSLKKQAKTSETVTSAIRESSPVKNPPNTAAAGTDLSTAGRHNNSMAGSHGHPAMMMHHSMYHPNTPAGPYSAMYPSANGMDNVNAFNHFMMSGQSHHFNPMTAPSAAAAAAMNPFGPNPSSFMYNHPMINPYSMASFGQQARAAQRFQPYQIPQNGGKRPNSSSRSLDSSTHQRHSESRSISPRSHSSSVSSTSSRQSSSLKSKSDEPNLKDSSTTVTTSPPASTHAFLQHNYIAVPRQM